MDNIFRVEIPKSAENLALPDPNLLDYYKDTEERIFWVDGEVDGNTLSVIKSIMKCNKEDVGVTPEDRIPIKIFIDTCGGDVQVMWSIVNAIKISKTPVYTICFCNALSAGAHILAAGHKRYAFPGSTILVHSGSCQLEGNIEQVESAKKYFDGIAKRANEMFLKDTKVSPKDLKRKGASDWYISAEDALKLGIVDAIVDDYEVI